MKLYFPCLQGRVFKLFKKLLCAGYVGEVYGYGLQLVWMMVGNFFGVLLALFTSIPLFYSLNVSSVNEVSNLFYWLYIARISIEMNPISVSTVTQQANGRIIKNWRSVILRRMIINDELVCFHDTFKCFKIKIR